MNKSRDDNSPLITVVVTTYNDTQYITQALDSVFLQKGMNLEVIAVDDNSTDNTLQVLKKYRRYSEITLIEKGVNVGPSHSRNMAIKRAKGEYLAFLDGDDYWLDGRLAEMLGTLKHENADVVFCDEFIKDEGKNSYVLQSSVVPTPKRLDDIAETIFKRNIVGTSAVLMRTTLAKATLFDEKLRSAEDYDFWIRIAATGACFRFLDKPYAVYRKYGESLSDDRELALCSTDRVLDKNFKLAKSAKARKYISRHRGALLHARVKIAKKSTDAARVFDEIRRRRKLMLRESIIFVVLQVLGRGAALKAFRALYL